MSDKEISLTIAKRYIQDHQYQTGSTKIFLKLPAAEQLQKALEHKAGLVILSTLKIIMARKKMQARKRLQLKQEKLDASKPKVQISDETLPNPRNLQCRRNTDFTFGGAIAAQKFKSKLFVCDHDLSTSSDDDDDDDDDQDKRLWDSAKTVPKEMPSTSKKN